MKVALLTTEFPPRVVGEVSNLVDFVAREVSRAGNEVHVITFDDWKPGTETRGGIKIHRVTNRVASHLNPFTWVSTLSCEFIRVFSDLVWDSGGCDLIHAFEWSTALSSIPLKDSLDIPYVQSFSSVEELRSRANLTLFGQTVKWIESVSTSLADAVIAHSDQTFRAVRALYPWCTEKLHLLDVGHESERINLLKIYKEVVSENANG